MHQKDDGSRERKRTSESIETTTTLKTIFTKKKVEIEAEFTFLNAASWDETNRGAATTDYFEKFRWTKK